MRSLAELQRLSARLQTERAHALSALSEEESRLQEAKQELLDAEEAQRIVQAAAQHAQQQAHDRLAGVVTRCLKSVFGEDGYEFKIEFDRKRGKTEARLYFTRDGHEIDPLSASGGGVVDVASMALRVACLMMAKPALRKLLVLDEPCKHLSEQYRPAVRELIQTLSEEAGIQFVIVTHDPEFQIGEVVEL